MAIFGDTKNAKNFSKIAYICNMKFKATLDFIHPTLGSKHFRDKEYELDENHKGNELLERVGYIKRLAIEVSTPNEIKEVKEVIKTKEFKGKKKTK